MRKATAIFIALLLVVGMFACVGAPDLPAVEEETPAPPVMETQPDEPEEPQQAAPAERIADRPVYQPPETPPETLAEAFAAVVYRLSFLDGDEYDPFPRHSFSLMDIDLDGELELIVHMAGFPNGFPDFVVFNKDLALEFIYLPNEHYEVFTFLSHNSVSGVRPMRFYRNDDTGDVVFSSLSAGFGGGIIYWVTYINNRTFEVHRVVECSSAGEEHHFHRLWDGDRWQGDRALIAKHDVGPAEWGTYSDECGIGLEGNSHQPTIVELVNMALEGFTEIPAPERHVFDGDYEHFFSDYAEEIMDWIHSVIG